MSRRIIIEKQYHVKNQELQNPHVSVHEYVPQMSVSSSIEQVKKIRRVLCPELDIFSELPHFVYDNEEVNLFLSELRRRIIEYSQEGLEGINLSKLRVTENTSVTIVIEWIFNYFRLYFSFDNKEGNYFGEVCNNLENGTFHNDFHKMTREDYYDIANAEVDYVIMMIGGA